jgi:adenylate cyclase
MSDLPLGGMSAAPAGESGATTLAGSGGGPPTKLEAATGLWARIKEHKLLQWGLGYCGAALAIAHGQELMAHAFGWPDIVAKIVMTLLVLGLPLVLTFAWYQGHRGLNRLSAGEMTIISLLMVVTAVLLTILVRTPEGPSSGPLRQASAVRPLSTSGQTQAMRGQGKATAFVPPPHSVAVLPFVNMSGDREREYFSDGLSEELLNALSRINELQVAARTSSFYFKDAHVDIQTIARKLNVASVLAGSVRHSGHTIRVTAELSDAITGYSLWSQTYDRDLGDVLKIQTDIASAVTSALKLRLLGNLAAKIEVGGTNNPVAFDAFLRASEAYRLFGPRMNLAAGIPNDAGMRSAILSYTNAIDADPGYALAYAGRSLAYADFARAWAKDADVRVYFNKAERDARKAIALAPDLADGHLALANVLAGSLKFAPALEEYERALALAPGNARLLKDYGAFAVLMGHTEAGLAAAQHLLVLDPLNSLNHFGLGTSLMLARRYGDAIKAFKDAKALAPRETWFNMWLGLSYYLSGDLEKGRAVCEKADAVGGAFCLAMVYRKLGRTADAQKMLARLQSSTPGERFAEGYADIYAQWGDTAKALDWLEKAMGHRDPFLVYVKINMFYDPLRNEPRFQGIERALNFPD